MYSLLLAIIYLAFISLGLPDALLGAAWPSMYLQFGVPVSYAGAVSMIIAAGTVISSLMSDRLTRRLGRGPCHGLQRADDGRRALRLLRQPLLLGPVLLGSALRHRRRLRGRGAEQLCRPPLQEPPHELAALLLGRRRLRRAVHNGLRAQRRPGLAHGLPLYSVPADRPHAGAVFEPAAVEEDVRRPGCGPRLGRPGTDHAPAHIPAGRQGHHARLHVLPGRGEHHRALGQQLSRAAPRTDGGRGRALRRTVLHRHNRRGAPWPGLSP